MSALQEVLTGSLIFAIFIVVIPVTVFAAKTIKEYYKGGKQNDLGEVSGRHQKR